MNSSKFDDYTVLAYYEPRYTNSLKSFNVKGIVKILSKEIHSIEDFSVFSSTLYKFFKKILFSNS